MSWYTDRDADVAAGLRLRPGHFGCDIVNTCTFCVIQLGNLPSFNNQSMTQSRIYTRLLLGPATSSEQGLSFELRVRGQL